MNKLDKELAVYKTLEGYRPIALLLIIRKVVKAIVVRKVIEAVKAYSLLPTK